MITSCNSKTSKCLICYQSFHKNVNLGNMLTQVMKIRSHRKVGFVIKVFLTKESLKACWKSSWDWTIIQKSKSPSCNKICSQKSESKHTFVGFVIKVFLIKAQKFKSSSCNKSCSQKKWIKPPHNDSFKKIQVFNLLSNFTQKCEPKSHVGSVHENEDS